MRHRCCKLATAICALFVTAMLAAPACIAAERPDIVIFLVDDLGRADVGFMGCKDIKTPNIDKLAASGAVLNQFYVQPVCSPTRAALMTGRYPMRYGLQVGVIRPWAKYGLPLEEQMLPEMLRNAGYSTVIVGKWHLGSFEKPYWPTARGFDHHYGHLFGALDYFTHERYGKYDWYRDGEICKDEGYSTHLVAREAVKFVNNQPKDKPLFLYVPFNGVHNPWQVPEQYKAPYSKLKEPRQTYAGMLAAVDKAIGQIIDATEKTGRRKNTLFIFSSDNGGPDPGRVTDNGPIRAGKGSLYEGGVRVCACVSWEGHIKPGSTVDEPLHVVDWYPTLQKLTGAHVKQKLPLDGRDAWSTIAKGKKSPHKEILFNSTPKSGAIRIGDWKLVVTENVGTQSASEGAKGKKAQAKPAEKPGVQLFNLRNDPAEKNDLAAENPAKVKKLKARYNALAKQAVTPKNEGETGPEE